MDYKEIAEKLWDLLDDIDAASDMFKPTDKDSAMNFYRYAMRKSEERHKFMKSDGYNLFSIDDFNKLPRDDNGQLLHLKLIDHEPPMSRNSS